MLISRFCHFNICGGCIGTEEIKKHVFLWHCNSQAWLFLWVNDLVHLFQEYMNMGCYMWLVWAQQEECWLPNWLTGCWKWLVPLGNRKTVSGIRNWDGGCCCQACSLCINVRLYPLGCCCHWLPSPLKLGNVASQVRLLSVLTVLQHAI